MTYDPGSNTAHDMDMTRRVHHPGSVRTITGRYVDVLAILPDDIDITDIAHGLSMICRYGGHVNSFYSVAEHSLNVAAQLHRMYNEPRLSLAGLLHDASEAYIGDMVRPLKHLPELAVFREIEANIEASVALHYRLIDELADPRLKQIDDEILPWEMAMVRDSTTRIAPPPTLVSKAFLTRYMELSVVSDG